MDAGVDHTLAAELAKIKRVLRRKERKLQKYNQVLGAKKHVRETLRRHNGASDSQKSSSSDPEKNITEAAELKSTGSRTVTFSNDSPKVIFVSPTPYLASKRKDKNHKYYRSLSSLRSNSQDRKKSEKESCAKEDKVEVILIEANPGILSPNKSNDKQIEKYTLGSDLKGLNDSPKICKVSVGSSSTSTSYEINTLKGIEDRLSFPKHIGLVSGNNKTVQNKLSICEVTESKVYEKECSFENGVPSDFLCNNETHYPSNSCDNPETTSLKNCGQAQDSRHPVHHNKPNNNSINLNENESFIPKLSPEKTDNDSSNTHIMFENVPDSENCANSVVIRKDNQLLHEERILSIKDCRSQNEVESQDLFATQLLTQSGNIEIKRSCVSHRKWLKMHRTSQSSSEGSGSGTSDKGEPRNKRVTGIVGQNVVSQVIINEPLTKIDMHDDHNTKMHQTEELMIKEIEQEMMNEFISEISEQEERTKCEISKESVEGKEGIRNDRSSNSHTFEVIHEVRHNDKVQNKLMRGINESENFNKCKFKNNCSDNLKESSYQEAVHDEDLFEDNLDVFVHEASRLEKNEQQNRCSNSPKESDALKEKGSPILNLVKGIPQEHSNQGNLPAGNRIAQKNCFEKVVKSDKARESLCINDVNVHSEYTHLEEAFISTDAKYEPQKFTDKENVRLHTLSLGEKYVRILTTSLVTLPGGNEDKINILTVHECGFTLWSASRKGRSKARSESQPADMQSSFGKSASSSVGLQEIWEAVSEVSHQVGRASDIRDIVAVGLPSDEETRFLVAITTTTEADLRLLCVHVSPNDKWLVIESGLGLSFCSAHKNLLACALGEWCSAIYWNAIEPSTSACFLVVDLDVTFSRRNKQWVLQCYSSVRSQILDRPLDCLIALNQPDPKGVVLCTAGNILYIYDAIENTILQQIKWDATAPSWTLATQELVFLVSLDIGGGKIHLTVLNPINGTQENFTETFPDDLRLHESNTEEATLKLCRTVRLTCACFEPNGLVIVLDSGAVLHVPFDALKYEKEPVKMENVQNR